MNKNIILCGVGGQGTVLASKLISSVAMEKGLPVMSAETIGMSQRGGSVFSHIRIGEGIQTPMIGEGEADMILAFEPGEAVRMLPYLKENGQMIVSAKEVMPVMAALTGTTYQGKEMLDYLALKVPNLVMTDTEKACQEIGTTKGLNVFLLGVAVFSGALGITEEELKDIIRKKVPEKFHELNFRALECAKEYRKEEER